MLPLENRSLNDANAQASFPLRDAIITDQGLPEEEPEVALPQARVLTTGHRFAVFWEEWFSSVLTGSKKTKTQPSRHAKRRWGEEEEHWFKMP